LVSKFGFSASYIESLPPIERELHLLYARQEQERQQKDSSPKETILGTPIDPFNSPLKPLVNAPIPNQPDGAAK